MNTRCNDCGRREPVEGESLCYRCYFRCHGEPAPIPARTPKSVRTITVVEVVALRGLGTKDSVARNVTQYWSPDGELLAERDPKAGSA